MTNEKDEVPTYADRVDEVVLETARPDRYQHTYRGYLVQAHDFHGAPLWDAAGRPLLVPQEHQRPAHPLDRRLGWVIALLTALLLALCIIGGIGLHYLDELVHPPLY